MICNELFDDTPADWWFEFVPLTTVKQEQQINMLNTFATAANTLIQNGVLNEYQIANELRESGLFANISAEDIEEMKNVNEFAGNFEGPENTEGAQVQTGEG